MNINLNISDLIISCSILPLVDWLNKIFKYLNYILENI